MSYPFKKDISKFKDMIRETKKYASEKGVPTWNTDFFLSMYLIVFLSLICTLFTIVFFANISFIQNLSGNYIRILTIPLPFLFSLFMIFKISKYLIKLMILKSYYMQKATMKMIDKLDMYLWRKTGKDSVVSSAIVKYKIPVGLIFWIPIIILVLLL